MTVFDQRKSNVLHDLHSDEPDLSPKGKPDEEVLGLLELLNAHDDYVSTSSCSGRAVVYLDADKNADGDQAKGRWLMNSHKPLDEEVFNVYNDKVDSILFGDMKVERQPTYEVKHSRLVNFKFEPLVICNNSLSDNRLYMSCVETFLRQLGC